MNLIIQKFKPIYFLILVSVFIHCDKKPKIDSDAILPDTGKRNSVLSELDSNVASSQNSIPQQSERSSDSSQKLNPMVNKIRIKQKEVVPGISKTSTTPKPKDSVLKPEAGQIQNVPKFAYVKILSSPAFAEIFLDSLLIGSTPMKDFLKVTEGQHTLELKHRTRGQKDSTVTLKAGDSTTIKIKF